MWICGSTHNMQQISESKPLQKKNAMHQTAKIAWFRKLGQSIVSICLTWTSRPQPCVTFFVLHSMTFQVFFLPQPVTTVFVNRLSDVDRRGNLQRGLRPAQLSHHLARVLCLSVSGPMRSAYGRHTPPGVQCAKTMSPAFICHGSWPMLHVCQVVLEFQNWR